MNLQQFIHSPLRNVWIEEPGLDYYVRKSVFFAGVIELSSCQAPPKSKKFGLARFLRKYRHIPFYMEQVIDPDLANLMRRMKWLERDVGGTPQFASPLMIKLHGDSERFQLLFRR